MHLPFYHTLVQVALTLVHSLWVFGGFALLYVLVTTQVKMTPGQRYSLVCLHILGGTALCILGILDSGNAPLAFINPRAWVMSSTLLAYTGFLYLVAIVLLLSHWAVEWFRMAALKKAAIEIFSSPLKDFSQRVALRMGIQSPVRFLAHKYISSPITFGFFKPVVILPVALLCQLDLPTAEALIVHELAHIRRADFAVHAALQILRVLLFFNPFAQYLIRQAGKERELACDAEVLKSGYAAPLYAQALLLLASGNEHRLALAASEKPLLYRVQVLLGIAPAKKVFDKQLLYGLALLPITTLIGSVPMSGLKDMARSSLPMAAIETKVYSPNSDAANYTFLNVSSFSNLETVDNITFSTDATKELEASATAVQDFEGDAEFVASLDESHKASIVANLVSELHLGLERNAEAWSENGADSAEVAQLRLSIESIDWAGVEAKFLRNFDRLDRDRLNAVLQQAQQRKETEAAAFLYKVLQDALREDEKTEVSGTNEKVGMSVGADSLRLPKKVKL